MNTSAMLRSFCDAVEAHDGKAFAELFTEDGVYHDVFYGAFKGRAGIAEMIDDWFYRTATDRSATAARSMRATPSATVHCCRRPRGRARCSRALRS